MRDISGLAICPWIWKDIICSSSCKRHFLEVSEQLDMNAASAERCWTPIRIAVRSVNREKLLAMNSSRHSQ